MGPRASKNAFTMYTAIAGPKKKNRFLPDFVWGFWPDFFKMCLGPKKIILLIRWSQSTHRSLSLKGLVKKVYRAFITDTNQIQPFSFVPPYKLTSNLVHVNDRGVRGVYIVLAGRLCSKANTACVVHPI